jgi:hypothetical protein
MQFFLNAAAEGKLKELRALLDKQEELCNREGQVGQHCTPWFIAV